MEPTAEPTAESTVEPTTEPTAEPRSPRPAERRGLDGRAHFGADKKRPSWTKTRAWTEKEWKEIMAEVAARG